MFNLLKRIYPALRNYPKSEKYALAQDTKICIFQYLNYVSRANNVKSKRMVYAQEAQGYLEDLKAKKMKPLIETRRMTIEKAEQILNSWLGHSSHGDSHNFITKLINKNNHIYMNEKGVLKIDESKIEFLEEGDVVAIF